MTGAATPTGDAAAAVRIELATPADVPAIVALIDAAYRHYVPRIGREPAPMTADHEAPVLEGRTLVARRADGAGEALVGALELEVRGDHLHVGSVAVDPAAQGLGIGGLLLAAAEARAIEAGLPEVRLYTNARMVENLAWYPRRGYVETGRAVQDGFDRVLFAKRL